MSKHMRDRWPLGGRIDPDLRPAPRYTPMPAATDAKPHLQARPNPGRLLTLVAACAAGLCAAGWFTTHKLTWDDYRTHVGGKQTAPLPDGSSVTLNTDTDLRVRMSTAGRDLALTRGEAMIKAAHDAKRPMRVVVGNTVIRTAGANFDVRKHDTGQVDVLVSDGRVATETSTSWPDGAAGAQSIVSAGYMASVRMGSIQLSPLDTGELERRTAWLRDVLDFKGETLAQAAEDFNRYNTRKIVIDDPDIASRRVGGVFLDTDPDSFVAALALTMNIRATTVDAEAGPGYGIIRLRSAQAHR